MANRFKIGSKEIGKDGELFVIAEIGLSHEGSLGFAHAMIDCAADAGADAVKFQTHIADEESTAGEQFRVKVFPQDLTRQDYWRRTSFSREQWIELADHARKIGIQFMSSPFSNLAVEWLTACDVPAWKIASGELTNYPMIEAMCQTGKPILVSSGMSSWKELDDTLGFITQCGGQYGVFQCTTSYPCPPKKWGLNVITQLRERYDCAVGLSDHSGTVTPSLAAIALGATLVEVHLALSQAQFGPDSQASITVDDLRTLCHAAKELKTSLDHPLDKDKFAADSASVRQLFSKSIVIARPLEKGHTLQFEDMAFKKPGYGISAKDYPEIIGKKLTRDVDANHFLTEKDFTS